MAMSRKSTGSGKGSAGSTKGGAGGAPPDLMEGQEPGGSNRTLEARDRDYHIQPRDDDDRRIVIKS
jgi:hypothetical protein